MDFITIKIRTDTHKRLVELRLKAIAEERNPNISLAEIVDRENS